MDKNKDHKTFAIEPELGTTIGVKVRRKIKARQSQIHGVWFGLGMMGLIGWSVAIPTILGASLGIYLDSHFPINHSWTLALLVAGLVIGCFNAWHWVATEERAIHEKSSDLNHKDENNNE